MGWIAWIAWKHPMWVHVPVAVALLLPWALLAAQRPGRGIKPWWVTCRYLAWAGVLGSLLALVSGFWQAQAANLIPQGKWLASPDIAAGILRKHQVLALGSSVAGLLCLRALFRRREEHQGLGFLGLFLGVVWSTLLLATGFFGAKVGRPTPPPIVIQAPAPTPVTPAVSTQTPAPPAATALDAGAQELLEVLDYTRLEPLHAEPVRSIAHGNRWVRTWISPEAVEAYRTGKPLPEGAWVVLSTQEERWGKPGLDAGPLCALRIKDGKPRFLYHWARVPQARRGETGGNPSATWQGDHTNLQACLGCHTNGLVPRSERSTYTVPRKPKEVS